MKHETLIVLAVAAGAVYLVMKRKAAAAGASAGVYNAYSVGAYGANTHVPISNTNAALVSTLGGAISSWFGGGPSSARSIPPDNQTPNSLGNPTVWNPVYPATAVLPYSYKQQVIDTPGILGTDQLFTPSDTGSSGSYADQGNSSDFLLNSSYA